MRNRDGFISAMLIHAGEVMTSIVLEQAVATADEMRRADAAAIAAGAPGEALMDRAGRAAASAIAAFTGPDHVLVLFRPGNNGRSGHVICRAIPQRGGPRPVRQLVPPPPPQP